MGTFLKIFGGFSLLAAIVIVGVLFFTSSPSGYKPSNDVLSAAEIAENPYKFKGMSGIMNPGLLWFPHMAGDQTAVYTVAVYKDQLAVTMDANDPPKTNRWWRVYVEGADDFTNGFGASVKIGEVRFEGYTDPPPQPVKPTDFDHFAKPPVLQPEPAAQHIASQDAMSPPLNVNKTPPPEQQLSAPIERRPATSPQPTAQQPESTPVSTQVAQSIAQNRNGQTALTVANHVYGQRYAYYFDAVQRTISQNWFDQEVERRSSMGKSVKLIFDINRDGAPSNIRVETPSGSPTLDLSAVQALQSVTTFGPLPAGDKQTVEDTFTYHPQ
jgi:protein TonB